MGITLRTVEEVASRLIQHAFKRLQAMVLHELA
jgi:hypothetical protein